MKEIDKYAHENKSLRRLLVLVQKRYEDSKQKLKEEIQENKNIKATKKKEKKNKQSRKRLSEKRKFPKYKKTQKSKHKDHIGDDGEIILYV